MSPVTPGRIVFCTAMSEMSSNCSKISVMNVIGVHGWSSIANLWDGGLEVVVWWVIATMVGATLGDFDRCLNSAFLDISGQVAAPAFQALDTQLKALPTLTVLARGVTGCVNSGNLDISRQFAAPACQADDSRLGALTALHVFAPGSGKTNPRRSCLCHREKTSF